MPDDDVVAILGRFYGETLLPDTERVLQRVDGVQDDLKAFRHETHANFDAVYKRLDRLESEYYAIAAAVARLEERMARFEQQLSRVDTRNELDEHKERVAQLQRQISELEADL